MGPQRTMVKSPEVSLPPLFVESSIASGVFLTKNPLKNEAHRGNVTRFHTLYQTIDLEPVLHSICFVQSALSKTNTFVAQTLSSLWRCPSQRELVNMVMITVLRNNSISVKISLLHLLYGLY